MQASSPMENEEQMIFPKEAKLKEPSSLINIITTKSLASTVCDDDGGSENPQAGMPNIIPLSDLAFFNKVTTATPTFHRQARSDVDKSTRVQATEHHPSLAVSLSMPASPSGLHVEAAKRSVLFSTGKSNDLSLDPPPPTNALPPGLKLQSQPVSTGDSNSPDRTPADDGMKSENQENQQRWARTDSLGDKRFDSFKTWSGRLEKQLSNLRGRPHEVVPVDDTTQNTDQIEPAGPVEVPVHRYFAALEGPELDTLRSSEESVLPQDKKWPFLLRFPISSFGMCLGIGSQAILWKTLTNSASTTFLIHVSPIVNMVLWCTALALMAAVTATYALKVVFYFEAVRREYYHPVRVNFFFAPWIACLFLVLGAPISVAGKPHHAIWYALMTPILCLELKIYGQWMSGGQRRLSKVANPSNHLSIVGNFVGALLGANMGLREGPMFFFAVGLAHYTVLFVTLYQRLPTNETLPKELHPVFFLFVAAPSVASTAWASINGDFDSVSKVAYFISMFLYFSLAVRVNFFRGFRFSLAWWAYTFPMAGAAIATIRYATAVRNPLTQSLTIMLSGISTLTVSALLVSTVLHAFVLKDLFPNDIAIAISDRKREKRMTFPERDLEADFSPDGSVTTWLK